MSDARSVEGEAPPEGDPTDVEGTDDPPEDRPPPVPGTPWEFVVELLRLAWPLILSSSFWTVQVTIDRVLLTWYHPDAVSSAFMVTMLFWTPFVLLQATANYSMTFVAQYLGAGRPDRIGPVIWQAIYFSVVGGLLFLALIPAAGPLFAAIDHAPPVQELEVVYFRCMCWVALPALIVAAVSGFFAGRGDSITVMWLNGAGLLVNAVLDYLWIFGHAGFPAMGIAGAGWATVAGMWVSALLGLGLMWRKQFRDAFGTLSGWRFDGPLFGRLMRFGLPAGLHWFLEMTAFTAFTMLLGWYGRAEFSASSIAFAINMFAFLPMLGMGQAISIMVGQRLGQDRPDLAAKSTWTGAGLACIYMSTVASLYVFTPGLFIEAFRSDVSAEEWVYIDSLVRRLLVFIAIYSVFDSLNMAFSFSLRGAGDTLFVSVVSLGLSWPMMVIPSWLAWRAGWSLEWPWAFASAYIITIGVVFMFRFVGGKWRSMRVIEPAVA